MAIINSGLTDLGARSEFFKRFDSKPRLIDTVATKYTSNTKTEKQRFLGATPQLREWGTGRLAKGLVAESYDISDRKYEATVEIDREEIEDDATGQIMLRIQELADRAATHPDYLFSGLLTNGGSAGFLSYDGETYFSTSHSSGSNDLTVNIDVDAPTGEPDTPLNPGIPTLQTAFDNAVAALYAMVDEMGEPLFTTDDGLMVICHPALKIRWMTALQAAFVGSTANVRESLNVQIKTLPWLATDSKAIWYLLKTNEVVRPFVFQERKAPEFKLIGPDSSEEFLRDKWYAGVRARYRVTFGRHKFCLRTTLV